jgi:hypothetical protein
MLSAKSSGRPGMSEFDPPRPVLPKIRLRGRPREFANSIRSDQTRPVATTAGRRAGLHEATGLDESLPDPGKYGFTGRE